ncbi:relaxase/mobilization nuclease domain-containing protein [Brucella pituitosa]|uniref:relaxase/mobilization nuclease domain-containing protein n=1 Tax=Brucella pituitosa TaxID=571256 RepID=UPI001374826E|nr:relaxase/mobilization nuclease domain-containing protein [Brucella pituitosa]
MSQLHLVGVNRYEYFKNVGGLNLAPSFSRASLPRYTRNLQRLPQVVFRSVKNGYCSGVIGLSAQLNYVLGKAERIIDPSGNLEGACHVPAAECKRMASNWADNWKKISKDGNHTIHLIASFPHDTPLGAVECILHDTCEDLLSQGRNRFDYIAAIHSDTRHPHAHIIVNRRNAAGEWFYLARDGEFSYDLFKDTLVKYGQRYGVELNNSSRLSRGIGDYARDSNPQRAMRGLEGILLSHGPAFYKYHRGGSASYYVTLNTRFGERTIWGVGLATILERSGAVPGDRVRIRHEGKCPIVVETQDRQTIITHRNDWRIVVAGTEYSIVDREITKQERAAANRRRAAIVRASQFYHRFADACMGTQTPLALAFRGVGDALVEGYNIERVPSFIQKNTLGDAEIAHCSQMVMTSIAKARGQLDIVAQGLQNIPATRRPVIEQRYFDALANMDLLLNATRRSAFNDKAEGSVYADEYRHQVAIRIPARTIERLEQHGISNEEFRARAAISNCSHALEHHWVQRDIAAIGKHLGLDLSSEKCREIALRVTSQLYSAIIEDIGCKHDLNLASGQKHRQMERRCASIASFRTTETNAELRPETPEHEARFLHLNCRQATRAVDENQLDDTRWVGQERAIGSSIQDLSGISTVDEIGQLGIKKTPSFEEGRQVLRSWNRAFIKEGLEALDSLTRDVFNEALLNMTCCATQQIAQAYSIAPGNCDFRSSDQDSQTEGQFSLAHAEATPDRAIQPRGSMLDEEDLAEREGYGL